MGHVADRVALGNALLTPPSPTHASEVLAEARTMAAHMAAGRILMSGRHLQHGDATQPSRPGEVTTNCSTAALSSLKKYLMLNGSGVGRAYDDALMLVDWTKQPTVITTLGRVPDDYAGEFLTPGAMHPEAEMSGFPSLDTAMNALRPLIEGGHLTVTVFEVPDSREGWAKAVEKVEHMTFAERTNDWLILDFSRVRPKGSPIGGMQNRPSSGPVPLMEALMRVNALRVATDMEPWEQTMYVDHYLSEVVLVGGARRAARIATKYWKDPGIFRFINIKQQGGLWTANNSVAVDAEFWRGVRAVREYLADDTRITSDVPTDSAFHAYRVFMAVMEAQFTHGSGEPGFINVDKLERNDDGMEVYDDGVFAGNSRYQLDPETVEIGKALIERMKTMPYNMIVNPCAEIPLLVTGGYCVLGSTVPFFADSLAEAIDAACVTARALVRANQMEFLYGKEVQRTNRIGLTLVGLQEYAWKAHGLGFRDLLDEYGAGRPFWNDITAIREAVRADVDAYCARHGLTPPHTIFTSQPAGTIAKLFGLTEAAHLAAMLYYLRWVQFRADDPLVDAYEAKGYPVIRTIRKADGTVAYEGMAIVGFPTQPLVTQLGIPDEKLVTATDASPSEQFQWLRLLEKYWLGESRGAQVSYTLKYNTTDIDFEAYTTLMLEHLPTVKVVSIMPASDAAKTKALFGYVPEEPISRAEFEAIVAGIEEIAADRSQEVDFDTLQCASGACPI
jgi:hypothetical protein